MKLNRFTLIGSSYLLGSSLFRLGSHYFRLLSSLFSSLVIFSIASQVVAQTKPSEQETERWFEVEIILYKSTSDKGLFDESWSKNTQLKLPEEMIDFLQPYSLPSDHLLVDEHNPIESNDKATSEITHVPDSVIKERQNSDKDNTSTINNSTLLHKEVPFTLLDDELLQLKKESQSIAKNSRYDLLAHFAWRQSVVDEKSSTPIRIAGGKDFQELFDYSGDKKLVVPTLTPETDLNENNDELHREELTQSSSEKILVDSTLTLEPQEPESIASELDNSEFENIDMNTKPIAIPWVPEIDGTIIVYIQRNYLHLDTNLFFRRPDKEEVDIFSLGSYSSPVINNNNLNSFSESTRSLEGFNTSQDSSHSQNNTISKNNDPYGLNNDNFSWQYDGDFLNQKTEKVYAERLFNYPLKQNRRLRSKELHYFDHPLIGVLVMIRPYEVEENLSELNDLE